MRLREDQSLESIDVMLHLFHRGSDVGIWRARDVVIDWIDRVLWHMPTLSAYRSRHDLTSDIINQDLQIESSHPIRLHIGL